MAVKRSRNPKGQLAPLSKSLTAHQAAMREDRRQWRSGMARQLGILNLVLVQFLQRGFFGRLRWILLGK